MAQHPGPRDWTPGDDPDAEDGYDPEIDVELDPETLEPRPVPTAKDPRAGRPAKARGSAAGGSGAGILALLPGLMPAAVIGALGWSVGQQWLPLVGGPVIALVLGMACSGWQRHATWRRFAPGVKFAGKRVLQAAIVLLGFTVSLGTIGQVGAATLPVLLGTLAIALLAAWLFSKLLRVGRDLGSLIGVGTSICGASAIAAIAPVIAAPSTAVALSVTTVFLYNLAAVLTFPWIGHALGMSQDAFGLFAGTAVNDTSSVVAAASIYGAQAAQTAVVVKLTRTLMIIPIALGMSWLEQRRHRAAAAALAAQLGTDPSSGLGLRDAPRDVAGGRAGKPKPVWKLVPWFIIGFVLAAAISSTGVVPEGLHSLFHTLATLLICITLAAIGLETDFAAFRRAGWRPIALGGLLWAIVTLSCLGLMKATGWI